MRNSSEDIKHVAHFARDVTGQLELARDNPKYHGAQAASVLWQSRVSHCTLTTVPQHTHHCQTDT